MSDGLKITLTDYEVCERKLATVEQENDTLRRRVMARPKLRISKNGIDYWLHMDAPSGNKASINMGSCNRDIIVDRVIQEMEGL